MNASSKIDPINSKYIYIIQSSLHQLDWPFTTSFTSKNVRPNPFSNHFFERAPHTNIEKPYYTPTKKENEFYWSSYQSHLIKKFALFQLLLSESLMQKRLRYKKK